MLVVSFGEIIKGGESKLEKERASVRKEKSKKKKNHEKVVYGFEIYCKVGLC